MESSGSVQARFVTTQSAHAVSGKPFNVPTSLRRFGLSEVLNHLLNYDPPVPFDFLINGEFLRTTLDAYLSEHNLSREDVVTIEYVEILPPPMPQRALLHDDWISAVDAAVSGQVVTGSYDGGVRVWDESGNCKHTLAGHTAPVKAVVWGPKSSHDGAGPSVILAAGQDSTVHGWSNEDKRGKVWDHVFEFRGHRGSVDAVSLEPAAVTQRFATGGWDHSLKLWSLQAVDDDETAVEEVKSSKKQKTAGKAKARKLVVKAPIATMSGHKLAVSAIRWATPDVITSAGWDHAIRLWSVETGINVLTLDGPNVITGIDVNQNGVVVAGHTDGVVRLYDPKSPEGAVVKFSLASHKLHVSSVSWCPGESSKLASTSLDGSVKLWDIRSKVPLHTITCDDKVFAASWATPTILFSGGADKKVQMHSFGASQ